MYMKFDCKLSGFCMKFFQCHIWWSKQEVKLSQENKGYYTFSLHY